MKRINKYLNGDTIRGDKYRQEGVLAQQYQEAEAARRHAEWLSRLEMRPVVVKKATRAEKIKGKKDVVKLVPQVVGMSGADPVGEFVVEAIGLNGIGALAKTGLWGVAKYAPKTLLGKWGREYFVGNAFKDSFNGAVPAPYIASKNLFKTETTKQKRVIPEGTYPWYRGKQHSVKEVVNPDGTVNPRLAMRILHEVSELFPGSYKMEHRLENKEYHPTDPTTYNHTKNVAQSAWGLDVPYGFTKHDLMVAALGHDLGKVVSGDGHAQIGADLAKQIFPDLTEAQYTAIAEHMGIPKTLLGQATKLADIRNGIVVHNINNKIRILLPTHTDIKPREIVLEPQGNNKYYVHMRVWDDVKNLVPGSISDIEKSNLFQTLYETLPEGAEILFPKSSSEYLGTRGTVAGLQRLRRDPRFEPGTPGTLLYRGKNGEILTYQGTSFIKKPTINKSEGLWSEWAQEMLKDPERLRNYIDELKETLTSLKIDNIKEFGMFNDLIVKLTKSIKDLEELYKQCAPAPVVKDLRKVLHDFYPQLTNNKYTTLTPGPYTERNVAGELIYPIGTIKPGAYADYRMEKMMDLLRERGIQPSESGFWKVTEGGPKAVGTIGGQVRELTHKPATLYTTRHSTNVQGFEVPSTGKSYVRVRSNSNMDEVHSTNTHEVIGHGTEIFINDVTKGAAMNEYKAVTDLVKAHGKFKTADSIKPGELRSTLLEVHNALVNEVKRFVHGSVKQTEAIIKDRVGKMSVQEFMKRLEGTNSYGKDYAAFIADNPQTVNLFKKLLTDGLSVAAPVGLTGYGFADWLKKGGKTHKPFGHRSILDNGWQSTKLLKNKKNVYGKSKS